MNHLVLVGISHTTAPVTIRERVAFPENDLVPALHGLVEHPGISEVLILSTCNRVEILAEADKQLDSPPSIQRFLYDFHQLPEKCIDDYLYVHRGRDVVRHMFRVASSLDSMVVGEPQILFQLKDAFRAATGAGSIGPSLNRLIPRAFFVAKRVRTETRVAASTVSVSSVAVELARKIFGDLSRKTVFMLGAGKMGELAGRSLVESGIARVLVTNRTWDKAESLAEKFSGQAVAFQEKEHYLVQADIVLVSTGARSHVIDRKLLTSVMHQRKYRPLFIIDISVPRNVDPVINEMDNVFLYDIDDLQKVIEDHLDERRKEAREAERIVDEEVRKFALRLSSLETGPVISKLRQRVEAICLEELEKQRNGFSDEQFQQLHQLLMRVAHKVAHPMIVQLKDVNQSPGERMRKLELTKEMFSLPDEDHD